MRYTAIITIKSLEVGTLRINSATGSPITQDSDLLREIRDALRDSKDLTVIQSIERGNQDILSALKNISNHAAGSGGGMGTGGPTRPAAGAAAAGGDDTNTEVHIIEKLLQSVKEGIISGIAEGEGGGGQKGSYYNREVFLSTLQEADRLFRMWIGKLTDTDSTMGFIGTFGKLFRDQANSSVKGFISSILTAGLTMTNLSTQFSNLTHKVSETVGSYKTEVFGSNSLGIGEYFFEIINRFKGGFLTASDSFRTVLKTVGDAIEQNVQSPLAQLGLSIPELSQEFVKARNDILKGGTNLLARGTAAQTERWMTDMVDTLHTFGQRANITSVITEGYVTTMVNHLAEISAHTGISNDKLEAMVKKATDEQNIMVGMGRLNADEGINRGRGQAYIKAQGSDDLNPFMNKMLAMTRPDKGVAGVLASPEHEYYAQMQTLFPGLIEQGQKLDRYITEHGIENTAKIDAMITDIRDSSRSFKDMNRNREVLATNYAPGVNNDIAKIVTASEKFGTMEPQSADQKGRAGEDPNATKLNTILTTWGEMISPFFHGIEFAVLANTAAIGLNIAALWANTAALGVVAAEGGAGGVGGMLKGLLGMGGKVLKYGGMAAGVAGMAYEGTQEVQSIRQGNTGTGVGGLAGAGVGMAVGGAIGSLTDWFTGPFGTILGGVIGQQIGSYVGGLISPDKPIAGPSPETAAVGEQTMNNSSASVDLMTRIHQTGEAANGLLSQIRGELSKQTGLLGATPSPEGAPAVGFGVAATGSAAKGSLRPDASYAAV